MQRHNKGFTLIELLIVVAIVAILALLLLPNLLTAIQKAKQKGTMQDITTIVTGLTDYLTDNGSLPLHSGTLIGDDNIHRSLSGFYIKVLPVNDQWGTAFRIYTGTNVTGAENYAGITSSGASDFLIASFGRDKIVTSFTYNSVTPETAYFEITSLLSYNEDLVSWNGSWIHVPRTAQTLTGS